MNSIAPVGILSSLAMSGHPPLFKLIVLAFSVDDFLTFSLKKIIYMIPHNYTDQSIDLLSDRRTLDRHHRSSSHAKVGVSKTSSIGQLWEKISLLLEDQ